MRRQSYDYSSVHINAPDSLGDEIVAWGKDRISNDKIFMHETGLGREDEIHITVLYGIHTANSQQTEELSRKSGSIKVRLGKIEIFESGKFDVVFIDVISEQLHELNNKFRKHMRYSNKFSEYKPHVTIAYVEKGEGWGLNQNDQFDGKEFECDCLVFSSKNGRKERIPLLK
jgi:2'-5' RNA ligase